MRVHSRSRRGQGGRGVGDELSDRYYFSRLYHEPLGKAEKRLPPAGAKKQFCRLAHDGLYGASATLTESAQVCAELRWVVSWLRSGLAAWQRADPFAAGPGLLSWLYRYLTGRFFGL